MSHLTENHRQTLHNLDISYEAPGTILRDFDAVLNFIGIKGVPVTAKHNVFPGKVLKPLNQEMTSPIVHNSKRAQFSSFPNISGLLLLLRCAGFAIIRKKITSNFLFMDENVVENWRKLNYIEQYFSLLNRWFTRGSGSIIGEKTNKFPLLQCHTFFRDHFKKNTKALELAVTEASIRYNLGVSNFALLEMFGLIAKRVGKSKSEKEPYVYYVRFTPLGEAILNLLEPYVLDLALFNDYLESVKSTPKTIQPIIQPYFPALHDFLKPTHQVFQEGMHLFKVSLGPVWRRILISGRMTFEDLSDVILNAFDFDQEDHSYQFSYINRYGLEANIVDANAFSDETEVSEVAIGDLALLPGENLNYLFDFGDSWQFEIYLESVNTSDNTLRKPKITERHGEAPEQYPDCEEW